MHHGTPEEHDGAPESASNQDGQRVDEASGQLAGPPGTGDTDQRAVDKAEEDLEKAGAGH